jgi:hypothetical protein
MIIHLVVQELVGSWTEGGEAQFVSSEKQIGCKEASFWRVPLRHMYPYDAEKYRQKESKQKQVFEFLQKLIPMFGTISLGPQRVHGDGSWLSRECMCKNIKV